MGGHKGHTKDGGVPRAATVSHEEAMGGGMEECYQNLGRTAAWKRGNQTGATDQSKAPLEESP